jgi:hypothetical protein
MLILGTFIFEDFEIPQAAALMMQVAHGAPLAQRHALDHVGRIMRDEARIAVRDFSSGY